MAVISEVKCGRCDRRYSGFRSRCPYCGARRNKRGKHADEADNAKAKMIIGVFLLVILIAATAILIFTNIPASENPDASVSDSDALVSDSEPIFSDNEGVTGVEASDEPTASASPTASADASAEPSDTASPSPSSNVTIQSLVITYRGAATEDVTLQAIGETVKLSFKTTPETTGKVAVWESSDPSVFSVIDGKLTALGKGSATLTCKVDGITAECIVRVRGT